MSTDTAADGYKKAQELLEKCATKHGFVASISDTHNYKRIWARDGVIIGLSALLFDQEQYAKTLLATLTTLKNNQGPHGEIPSNVDPESNRVSLGGTTGRVDANLWFLIGCEAYWNATKDEHFLSEFLPHIKQVEFLLGCWEFNNRGLLFVPPTGDWSDEYVQNGYILYDQLLYWKALKGLQTMYQAAHKEKEADFLLCEKTDRLHELIKANYWFVACEENAPGAYHPVLHKKGCEAAEMINSYWFPFFSPTGYGYRFDAMANVLVSLLGIADKEQSDRVDAYIAEHIANEDMLLLPAFHPVISPDDMGWEQLQVSFSFDFKNKPYEFHNGGMWQFVTAFYVSDLVKRGKKDLAKKYMDAIDRANKLGKDGEEWGFYEYIHGKDFTPGGTKHQGWSASGAILAHLALEGTHIF